MALGSAGRVSKPGSLSPGRKRRRAPTSLVSVSKRLFQQQNPDLQRKFKHLADLWLVATACDSLRLLPDSGTTWKSVVKKNTSFTGQRESGTIVLRGFSLT